MPVGTLAVEIARELARDGGLGQSVVYTPDEFALSDVPAFLPNPAYAPDAPGRFLSGLTTALRRLA
ncbi:hypothetical protein [Streptomyces sp. NBC_00557]|uniref:hypothetical protein n=1 Tax=Streptomyces sp. NBC_00557 TaxID=2975776 RepID=UPI002E8205B2|nr:hypothetical protein [Streptomyces sp. NBC_00557]WUC40123.1 hypothetical protein OG956_00200 [Streptomyces sp. NBC_00557]